MTELFHIVQFEDTALLFVRLALAAIFIYHGYQKIHYWKMHHTAEISAGWLAVWRTLSVVEIVGGAGMMFGAFTKIAALLLCMIMLGAMYFKIKKWKKEFSGDGGWEFDLVLFTSLFLLFIIGGGAYSIDWQVFGL